ncbi:MAG: hypothetical protein RR942_01290 [Romboutsia sp.]
MKRLTIDVIKERLKETHPNIEILSTEYKNAKSKLLCKCKTDGYQWETTGDNLQRGVNCPMCSKCRKDITLEEIKRKLEQINNNIIVMSTKYINGRTNLKLKCKIDNYEWNNCWNNLQQGQGCPKCSNKAKRTLSEIQRELININPNIEIIDKEYVNAHTKMKCRCIKGHVWEATWNNLQHGTGCKQCDNNNRKGANNHFWKNGITPLYNRIRDSMGSWKKDSYNKYDRKCFICRSKEDIEVHHNKNFASILYETLDTLNMPIKSTIGQYTTEELDKIQSKCLELHYKYGLGVCLCHKHHSEFHKIYTKHNNTKEQLIEFKANIKKLKNKINKSEV